MGVKASSQETATGGTVPVEAKSNPLRNQAEANIGSQAPVTSLPPNSGPVQDGIPVPPEVPNPPLVEERGQ